MVKKIHYTWKDVEHMIVTLNNLMFADNWRPDYIVGLTRGGLVPATIMSNTTGITCHTLDVRFRDTDENYVGPESNTWMATDAYGTNKDGLTGDHYKRIFLLLMILMIVVTHLIGLKMIGKQVVCQIAQLGKVFGVQMFVLLL